jgi:hypothetical protein
MDSQKDSVTDPIVLPSLGLIFFVAYAWLAHLSPEQIVAFIGILAWPTTTLLVASFFRKELGNLLNRIRGAKVGSVELQIDQKALEVETAIVAAEEHPDEPAEFERYNLELVANTRGALFWFSQQPHPVTLAAFLQIFGLPNPIPPENELMQEKLAIFNALLLRGLIENHGPTHFKISSKGTRYLKSVGIG